MPAEFGQFICNKALSADFVHWAGPLDLMVVSAMLLAPANQMKELP